MPKQINFFDGAESSTTPTIGNIDATSLVPYANDAAYEAANLGSPAEGNIYFNTTINVVRYYNGTDWQSVLDEQGTQTLQNKTIDGTAATGNNTVTIDSDNASYDNTTSGLSATNAQDAIDEVDATNDTQQNQISDNATDILALENLSGVGGASDLGTFTGSTISDNTDTKTALQELETAVETKQDASEKGQPNGLATLDGSGLVPASQLPSFVDDVLEYADFASLPGTGETGKIYVTLDDNKTYRWTGSIYIEVGSNDVTSVNSQTGDVSIGVPELDDTLITSVAARDFLYYDGSQWINFDIDTIGNAVESGSDVVISADFSLTKLTNGGLVSISEIDNEHPGKKFVLTNLTGNPITINNERVPGLGSAIRTGTGGDLDLEDKASLYLAYDNVSGYWYVVGGTGSGGSGLAGAIQGNDQNLNSSLGNWTSYADAAQDRAEDGTGGTANITVTRTTLAADILNGKGSLKISKGAFNRQGEGASLDFEMPKKFRGKELELEFAYDFTSNFLPGDISSDSDIVVQLYDITNSKFISLPNEGRLYGDKQFITNPIIPANCEDARLILHIATTNGNDYEFISDDFRLDIKKKEYLNLSNTYEIKTLSSDLTADTVDIADLKYDNLVPGRTYKLTINLDALRAGGGGGATLSAIHNGNTILNAYSDGDGGTSSGTGGNTLSTNLIFEAEVSDLTFNFTEIVNGTLRGNGTTEETFVMLEELNDYESKEVASASGLSAKTVMRALKSSGSTGANVDIPSWDSVEKDSVNGFDATTGLYTVKTPGDYFVYGNFDGTGSGNPLIYIYVNGVDVSVPSAIGGGSGITGVYSVLTDLKYGDTISLRLSADISVTELDFSLFKIASEQQPYAPRVCYIKEQVAANTASGTFTSGAWQTRNLTDQSGDFFTVSGNQITLLPGKYHIEAKAPAYRVNSHKIKLRNITDSTDDIIGESSFADNAFDGQSSSFLEDEIFISEQKVFEIQHRCTTTQSGNGFGVASNMGVDEVYTQVKITKIL